MKYMKELKDEIGAFCREQHLKLNTDLGQHFLVDQTVLDAIIAAAKIQPDDQIIEIGPGIGVLTKELLKRTKNVTAIELDTRLIPLLRAYTGYEEFTVIENNALQVPLPETPYKIVANIPYHITSPLLRHMFLESKTYPTSVTLLIQREVAEKICDQQNGGILTVLVALFGTARIVTHVPPWSFLPAPKVHSSVLHIDCYSEPKAPIAAMEEIFALTKIAFAQKRKMLRNSFGTFPGGLELLSAVGIDPTRRAQTLSVEEWIALAEAKKNNA